MIDEFVVSDEWELLEFFGAEPVERSVEDGYWCYEASDARAVTLRFSFNLFERSVQTFLLVSGTPLATVTHEGASQLAIQNDTLVCLFSYLGAKTKLLVRLGPSINVEWSSLRSSD